MMLIRSFILMAVAFAALGVTPSYAQDAALVEQGMAVFEAQRCRLCHAIGDEGNKKGPLDDVGDRLSADEIRAWIVSAKEMAESTGATRKPAMKDFSSLPEEEVTALVAYLGTLKGS